MTHTFDTDIAQELGIEAAVILQNFAFWITKNIASEQNIHDGKAWTYNSYEALNKLFPYIKQEKIKRVIIALEKEGILVSRTDLNKNGFDKTKWYSFTEHPIAKRLLGEAQNSDAQSNRQNSTPERANLHDGECNYASSLKNNNQRQIKNTDNKPDNKNLSVSFFFSDKQCCGKNGTCKIKSAMTINDRFYCSQHGRIELSKLGKLDLWQETEEPKKRFSFTLSQSTQLEHTSKEYKEKLKGYAVTKDGAKSFEEFMDFHIAKGSKFKDWSRAYNTWLNNSKKFNNFNPQNFVETIYDESKGVTLYAEYGTSRLYSQEFDYVADRKVHVQQPEAAQSYSQSNAGVVNAMMQSLADVARV